MLSLKHVTVTKVNKPLKGLKNTKSTAIDELDNFCIKAAAGIIDKLLHHIITLSILQSKVPQTWKFSKVARSYANFRSKTIFSP